MIAFFADGHLGNHRRFGGKNIAGLNDRARAVVDVIENAVSRAKALGAPLVSLGDLFDTARPEPQLIAAAQRALSGVDCYALLGNHEQVSTASGDHSLGPLHNYDMIEVIDGDGGEGLVTLVHGTMLLLVPFQPGKADDWLPAQVACLVDNDLGPAPRVLCLHLGIRDEATPSWLENAHDSVSIDLLRGLAETYDLDAIVAGNWHERRRWDLKLKGRTCEVMQVGALVPTGFDNAGLNGYGTLALFDPKAADGKRLTYEELSGPRFIKLKAGDKIPKRGANKVYVQVTAPQESLADCDTYLKDAIERGDFEAGEVLPDGAEVQEAAREAASSARSEDTLQGALAAFVEKMPLEDLAVDRAKVLARCKGYLAADGRSTP